MTDLADPLEPLQRAIVRAVREDAPLIALVDKRIYDDVPPKPTKPYLSFGPVQVLPEDAAEYDGADVSLQIDGWSASLQRKEIAQIGRALRALLHNVQQRPGVVTVEGHRLVSLRIEDARYIRDDDGVSQHGVFSFRARLEPIGT